MSDSAVLLWGEIRFWSVFGFKELTLKSQPKPFTVHLSFYHSWLQHFQLWVAVWPSTEQVFGQVFPWDLRTNFSEWDTLELKLCPALSAGALCCNNWRTCTVTFFLIQARKDGCNHDKAGLIPSKDFQER